MTREEAIQFIDNIKHEEAGRAIGSDGFFAKLMGYHVEALQMAISDMRKLSHIMDRPCEYCCFHLVDGCGRWECWFDGKENV